VDEAGRREKKESGEVIVGVREDGSFQTDPEKRRRKQQCFDLGERRKRAAEPLMLNGYPSR
jgi:hypothetical protein